jgi:hypothetical protein
MDGDSGADAGPPGAIRILCGCFSQEAKEVPEDRHGQALRSVAQARRFDARRRRKPGPAIFDS